MDYSIAIGINNYDSDKFASLKCAENDATTFFNIMNNHFNLNESNNILLLGEKASKNIIDQNIAQILSLINSDSRVFFFFAGHGERLYQDPCLSCYDSKYGCTNNPDSWLNVRDLIGKFSEKNVNTIFFLDSCCSTISFSPIPRGIGKTGINNEKYICVFSAADSNQNAYEDCFVGHGKWSQYLFKALQGEPGALTNGKLTNNSLQNYLRNNLDEGQRPFVWGKNSGEFVIKDFSEVHKKVSIRNIYFGTIDADNEIKEDRDLFIENYFDLNDVSKKLMESPNIQFVTGRKGTGKTYIGKYMEVKYKGNVHYLSIENFDYKAFVALSTKGEGYLPYVSIWKYFILANLLMRLNGEHSNNKANALLKELYGREASMNQILNKKFKKGVSIKNKELMELLKLDLAKEDENFVIADLIQCFLYTVEDIEVENQILVLDGLDEKINENRNYELIMNALIWAIKELNDYMFNKNKTIKCVAFFRTDVFAMVQGANTAKISNGSRVNLTWVNESDDKTKYPLYKFINLRYQNCLNKMGDTGKYNDLLEILPSTIIQGNTKVNTWEWMLDFTTYKPRDIVIFLRECINRCTDETQSITEGIIWEAQDAYSKYLIAELENELYGFINENIIKSLFNELHSMGKKWNSYDVVKGIINKCANKNNISLKNNEEVNNVILKLYEVGVIGIKIPNEHEHWSYRRTIRIEDYLEKSEFKVHRGLWKGLSIW